MRQTWNLPGKFILLEKAKILKKKKKKNGTRRDYDATVKQAEMQKDVFSIKQKSDCNMCLTKSNSQPDLRLGMRRKQNEFV